MKILQTSDTHWGLTKPNAIRKMFKKIKEEEFDILLHCGDYCGTRNSYKSVNATVCLMRETFPDKPIITVLGNHDYWTYNKRTLSPSLRSFEDNYNMILESFKTYDIHFLDEEGLYRHPEFPNIILCGHTGWYSNMNPPTNDTKYLPKGIEGNTNAWLLKNAEAVLEAQLQALDRIYQPLMRVCFVSHFPVVNSIPEHQAGFHLYCWNEKIKQVMQENYNCKYFFCGHAHKYKNGPLRYESGSDYYKPKYHIVEVL